MESCLLKLLVLNKSPQESSHVGRSVEIEKVDDSRESRLPNMQFSPPNSVPLDVETVKSETAHGSQENASCNFDTNVTSKKSTKRKRESYEDCLVDKESQLASLSSELDSLSNYFREVSTGLSDILKQNCSPVKSSCQLKSAIAILLQESNLSCSKLAENIFEKLTNGCCGAHDEITLISVRNSIIELGQRTMYADAKADVDALEDESETRLWCWEIRDLKWFPRDQQHIISVRRTCRKKIHERIVAISDMMSALSAAEDEPNHKSNMMKAAEKMKRTLPEARVRASAQNLMLKKRAKEPEKEMNNKENETSKEIEKNALTVEKDQKRIELEFKKEKLLNEKQLKKHMSEVEKEQKRREKEEAEARKQLKRCHEEQKQQKRREKEEAELKKKAAIQKQASIMERFVKREKQVSDSNDQERTTDASSSSNLVASNSIISVMDHVLSQEQRNSADLLKLHLVAWRHKDRPVKPLHWAIRRKPKIDVIKELKLQGPSPVPGSSGNSNQLGHNSTEVVDINDENIETLVDGWSDSLLDARTSLKSSDIHIPGWRPFCLRKKLLQFDKSYRPAYYGTISRKSNVVGPRRPFKKDSNLDYDIDSDAEWEEEDPGESLSDCGKDEEEEKSEAEENMKTDDEDMSDDGFLVPDGYLSENEGVHMEGMEDDTSKDQGKVVNDSVQDNEPEEFKAFLVEQRHLSKLTENALRKNKPMIILNLMNEKNLLEYEDLDGTMKLEQMCLQALCIRRFAADISVETVENAGTSRDDQCVIESEAKTPVTPAGVGASLQDCNLHEVVSIIQDHCQAINKVVEALHKKFPSVPKTHLRNKVKELAEFVDNRWQVKKDVLKQLGLSASPEKNSDRSKGITTFFKKRCMPPDSSGIDRIGTSPTNYRRTDSEHRSSANVIDQC